MKSGERGFTLIELSVCAAVMAAVLMLVGPPLLRVSGDLRLRVAAAEAASVLRSARFQAVRYNTHVAVRFRNDVDGRITYAMYQDGDGDGVLARDIDKGVDPELSPPRPLGDGYALRFGFPPGLPVVDPGDSRRALSTVDPIRFNQSDMASFGPLGESTPGSLYLTDGATRLAVVRLYAWTGKVRVLMYDFKARVWR
jgi:prepilin-type N-terminal cleavage/methylation domain-containing protein